MSRKSSGYSVEFYRRVGQSEVGNARARGLSDFQLSVWADSRMGQQSSRLGLGRHSVALQAEDLGRPIEDVRSALSTVCEALGWTYDASNRWLFIPEVLRVTWDGSPDQLTGYRREIERQAPPPALLAKFDEVVALLDGTSVRTTAETTPDTTSESSEGTSPTTTGTQYKYKEQVQDKGLLPPSPSATADYSRLFEEVFWPAWPHKTSKKDALKAFLKIRPSKELLDRMLESIALHKVSNESWRDGFIPHAATWLNGERWNDEVPQRPHRSSGVNGGAIRAAGPAMRMEPSRSYWVPGCVRRGHSPRCSSYDEHMQRVEADSNRSDQSMRLSGT